MRTAIAIGVAVLLASAGARAQSGKALSRNDRAEIQELYARYAHAIDTGNGQAYIGVFTDDGVLQSVTGGPDSFTMNIADIAKRAKLRERPKITHFYSNIVIDPAPEGARGQAYVLLLDLQKNPAITSGSLCDDSIVKTKAGWKFKKRVCYREPGPTQAAGVTSSR
jgi:hypothetical protein